jgi:SAM-dependent methyltransferase
MSDFYTLLARYYDEIFPAEPEIVEFLVERLGGAPGKAADADAPAHAPAAGPRVIDAACGTGNYTDALASRGFDCLGFDASAEMIEIARHRGKRGRFEVRDLRELGGRASEMPQPGADGRDRGGVPAKLGRPADGLFCIGNSLPHLPDRRAVDAFFGDTAGVVRSGGSVIVQTVNFTRFAGGGETPLPPVERPGIRMVRSYRPGTEPGTVVFHAELTTADGERAAGDTPLLALTREDLVDAAQAAGLRNVEVAGGFDGSPYESSSSFLMVLTAKVGDAGSNLG